MKKIQLACLFVFISSTGFSQELDYVRDAFAIKDGQDYRKHLMISENDSSFYYPKDSSALVRVRTKQSSSFTFKTPS